MGRVSTDARLALIRCQPAADLIHKCAISLQTQLPGLLVEGRLVGQDRHLMPDEEIEYFGGYVERRVDALEDALLTIEPRRETLVQFVYALALDHARNASVRIVVFDEPGLAANASSFSDKSSGR
jgi:hypothetical protein